MREKGFLRPVVLVMLAAIIVGVGLSYNLVQAAKPAVSLEQCRNGSLDTPNDCEELGGGVGWVSGNAGASQAHLREGYSIPYRLIATDLPTAAEITLDLGYDIKHSDTHALDFLTHYDRLEPHDQFGHPAEDVSPLDGVTGVSASTATCSIPQPSNLSGTTAGSSFAALPAGEKLFTVFGGTSCSVTELSAGDLTASQSEASITVTFQVDSATAVLAWGGHIATAQDWGAGNSASNVSGSPYHMRALDWNLGNLGNQDRSLAAAAVISISSSVTTEIHLDDESVVTIGGSVPLGSTVHDEASVDGASPTGDVDFTFFTGGDCSTGTSEGAGNVTLSSGVAHPSDSKGPLTAGNYAFQADYNGDLNNDPSTSDCEPFSVSKGNLTVTTEIHLSDDHTTNYDANASGNSSASVPFGSQVHDVAFVSGQVGSIAPTGAISFTMWSNGTCTGEGSALSTSGTDEGGSGTRSADTSALSSGEYSFKATIAADPNYNSATSPCERLVVDQSPSSVVTEIHLDDETEVSNGSSIALGSTVHDEATVTGASPTGDVDFTFYRGGDCSTGTSESAGTVTLSSGVAHPSDSKGPLTAGSYAFQADYNGDADNDTSTSGCEPFSVSKGDLTVTTEIHLSDDHSTNYDTNASGNSSASVPFGSQVHDVAFVSGEVGSITPTGTISFTMWSNGDCSGEGSALSTSGDDEGGSGTRSVDTSSLSDGEYSFKATIAADDNYNSATSSCERLVVGKAPTSITTSPWVYPNDSATISASGGGNVAGTVTFSLYDSSANCTAGGETGRLYQESVNLVGDSTSETVSTSNTSVKVESNTTVWWSVSFVSSNSSQVGRNSICVEQIAVTLTGDSSGGTAP